MKLSSTDLTILAVALHESNADPRFVEYVKLSLREYDDELGAAKVTRDYVYDLLDRINAEAVETCEREELEVKRSLESKNIPTDDIEFCNVAENLTGAEVGELFGVDHDQHADGSTAVFSKHSAWLIEPINGKWHVMEGQEEHEFDEYRDAFQYCVTN